VEVTEGDQVETGRILVVVEPDHPDPDASVGPGGPDAPGPTPT